MSDEKINKSEQSQPKQDSQKEVIIKGYVNEKLYSERPITEGYQPTDRLDTSNPPVDKGDDITK